MTRNENIKDALNEGMKRIRFCASAQAVPGNGSSPVEVRLTYGQSKKNQIQISKQNGTDDWIVALMNGINIRFEEEPRALLDDVGRVILTTSHANMGMEVSSDDLTCIAYHDFDGTILELFDGTILTPEEGLEQLQILLKGEGNIAQAHREADEILVAVLRSMGHNELCDVYETLEKWYE